MKVGKMMNEVTPENSGKIEVTRDSKGRFLPGVSGHPAGKPLGTKSFTTKVKEALQKIIDDEGTTAEQQLVRVVIEKALKEKDPSMIKLMWNYFDGMPKQFTDVTTKGERIDSVSKFIVQDYGIQDIESI